MATHDRTTEEEHVHADFESQILPVPDSLEVDVALGVLVVQVQVFSDDQLL
jgi:hypothetical protein